MRLVELVGLATRPSSFLLLILIGSTVSASIPEKARKLRKLGDGGIYPKDWLTDVISQLLGISVSDLLKLINSTLIGMENLVEEAVDVLQKIMSSVNPEAQAELQEIINVALAEVLELIQPILDQMGQVIPVITKEVQTRDLISDIILAILGITLEELLTRVTEALADLNIILNQTLETLSEVAGKVNESSSKEIEAVSDNMVEDARQLLSPLLNMLRQIFPESIPGCLITSDQRKEFAFRNSENCES